MGYLEQCTKYFRPIDEIAEAIRNSEGLSGLSRDELVVHVASSDQLSDDLFKFEDLEIVEYM